MRRHEPLPPDVARELEDLDAALAGAPGADPELAALVEDVQALRAEPDPSFLASLDARVLGGFPAGERAPRRARRRRPNMLVPAFGLFAAAVVAVVIVAGSSSPGGDRSSSGSGGGSSGAASAPAKSSDGAREAAPSAATDPAGGGAVAAAPALPTPAPAGPIGGRRRVERNAELALVTSPDAVQDVADGIVRSTQAAGGFVARSQVQSSDGGGSAQFTLQVPTRGLDGLLASLSKLAHVGSLTQGSTDITGSFVSLGRRLGDARAERRALLRALGRATTTQEIASLRARLRLNRAETAALQGERRRLQRRADLATVAVLVEGTGKRKQGGSGAWTPGDALHDAGRVLEVAAGVALIALAAAVPLALLGLLAALAARGARRRRREAALDGA